MNDFLQRLQALTEKRNALLDETNTLLEAEDLTPELRDQVKVNQDQIVDIDDRIDILERQNGFTLKEAAERMTESEVINKDVYASDEYKRALNEFLATGNDYAIRAILDDTNSTYGAYLIPVKDEYLRKRIALNPIRKFANVVSNIQPVEYTPLIASDALAQGDSWDDTSDSEASTSVTPYLLTSPVIMHPRVYYAGMGDMDEEIVRAAEAKFATKEAALVITGDGSLEATGVLDASSAGETAAADDAFTLAEFRALIASLSEQYLSAPECKLIMNRSTYNYIIALKRAGSEASFNPENNKELWLDGYEVLPYSAMASTLEAEAKMVLIADLWNYHIRETGLYVRKSNDGADPRKHLFIVEKFFGANLLDSDSAKHLILDDGE